MNNILKYTVRKLSRLLESEKEDELPRNTTKIRRPIVINGQTVWVSGKTEQEYADNLLAIVAANNKPTVVRHNFEKYATAWFRTFSKPTVDEATSITYARQLKNYIFPEIGSKNIEEVLVSDIQKIFNSMGSAKQDTKNKVKIVLNQIFKMAYEDGVIDRNPMESSTLRIKGEAAKETEPYSVEQMRYLVSHIVDVTHQEDRVWLILSISLPLRPEEVLGLRWRDLEGNILHIRSAVTHPTRNEPHFHNYTKTAKSVRDLIVPKFVLMYLPRRGADSEFIVGGPDPISYSKLRNIRKRLKREMGFDENIVPRRFRTTVATDISASTHDIKLVQNMLGHANPQTTLRHYDKGRSRAADATAAIEKCYGFDEFIDENQL